MRNQKTLLTVITLLIISLAFGLLTRINLVNNEVYTEPSAVDVVSYTVIETIQEEVNQVQIVNEEPEIKPVEVPKNSNSYVALPGINQLPPHLMFMSLQNGEAYYMDNPYTLKIIGSGMDRNTNTGLLESNLNWYLRDSSGDTFIGSGSVATFDVLNCYEYPTYTFVLKGTDSLGLTSEISKTISLTSEICNSSNI